MAVIPQSDDDSVAVPLLKKHILVLICEPAPQVFEHTLQVDHGDHDATISVARGTVVSSIGLSSGPKVISGTVLSQNGGVVVANPSGSTIAVSGDELEGITATLALSVGVDVVE